MRILCTITLLFAFGCPIFSQSNVSAASQNQIQVKAADQIAVAHLLLDDASASTVPTSAIQLSDYDRTKGTIIVQSINGKRTVTLSDRSKQLLEAWLRERGDTPGILFPDSNPYALGGARPRPHEPSPSPSPSATETDAWHSVLDDFAIENVALSKAKPSDLNLLEHSAHIMVAGKSTVVPLSDRTVEALTLMQPRELGEVLRTSKAQLSSFLTEQH
jgi:hypothetical protein